jgi:D-beta-D-heptose 7-phosphate kinase/D-beta-D-heptose 1-phosphate adenosyltransferase
MLILITGGFDPLHSGHIDLFYSAAKLGKVVVAVNSDRYLQRKKSTFLLPREERLTIVASIRYVTDVITEDWDDSYGHSCAAIELFYRNYNKYGPLAFANGGDRTSRNSDEQESNLCASLGMVELFNIGGPKTLSSSNFLNSAILRKEMNT